MAAQPLLSADVIPSSKGLFKQSFETVTLPGDEPMGFWGGGMLYDITPSISVGPAVYGAATGQRGGFITLGVAADSSYRISDRINANAGYFVGAGGGRGGYTLSGGGLMLRAHAGLDYNMGKFGLLGVGVSNLVFPNGHINSTQPYISYTYPFTTLFARGWQQPNRYASSTRSAAPAEKEISIVMRRYDIPAHVTKDNGGVQHPTLQLIGAELVHYVGQNGFLKLESEGAFGGDSQGYMQVLMGGGYRFAIGKTTAAKLSAATGFAGGGAVDTGGGILLDAQASVQQKLTDHLFVELGVGHVAAPQASFEATSLSARLGYSFNTPKMDTDHIFLSSLSGYENKHFRFRMAHQTYLKADPNWRSHHNDLNIDNLGVQFDYFQTNNLYLTGQGIGAYAGEAGAYMTGLIGAGYHQPFANDKFYADVEFLLGAAGGGGADVNGGFVWQSNANLGYYLNDKTSLSVGIGRMEAPKGNFKANVINFGLVYNFDVFMR